MALGLLVLAAACESHIDRVSDRSSAMLWQDSDQDFWSRPWPDDARNRSADGFEVSLAGFPNPASLTVLDDFLGSMQVLLDDFPGAGFSTNGAIYLPFDGPLADSALPETFATARAGSGYELVDITEGPSCGERIPVMLRWKPRGAQYLEHPYLVALPVPGFPLRPRHQYLFAVTARLYDTEGRAVQAPADWRRWADSRSGLLTAGRGESCANQMPVPALDQIAAGTLFTTGDPSYLARSARRVVLEQTITVYPPYQNDALGSQCRELSGWIRIPNFQRGAKPYLRAGGDIAYDERGYPVVQTWETTRYSLLIPTTVSAGTTELPLLIVGHGTGGYRRSFVTDGTGRSACEHGIAAFGISQPLHGDRQASEHDDPMLMTFNFMNLRAMVHNFQQGGFDLMALRHGLQGHSLTTDVTGYNQTVSFRAPFMYLGHSQGSHTGAFFGAVEPDTLAGILYSGSSGHLISILLAKDAPIDFSPILEAALASYGELDEFSPLLTLFQTVADAADPINYARYYLQEPIYEPGSAEAKAWQPRHVLGTEGIYDEYTPPPSTEAFLLAAGLQYAGPYLHAEPVYDWLVEQGLRDAPRARPTGGNLVLDGTNYTALWTQYPSGHFSIRDTAQGRADVARYLDSLAHEAYPSIAETVDEE